MTDNEIRYREMLDAVRDDSRALVRRIEEALDSPGVDYEAIAEINWRIEGLSLIAGNLTEKTTAPIGGAKA